MNKVKVLKKSEPHFSLGESILVLLLMLIVMGFGVIGLKLSPEIPILVSIIIVIFWSKLKGFSWDQINDSFVVGIKNGIVPLFIFILIGALIGAWIISGIIPSLMVFGFHLISAQWFLPSVFIVCGLVGCMVGSTFTVVSTLGIAFMGIGITMGINPAMVAGAVLSGAIFGDKSSPLSATNNLSVAVVGADLMDHIKNLTFTTLPALVITFVIYLFIGHGNRSVSLSKIHVTEQVLTQHFSITFWAIIPILLLFICAWVKIPTVPTLLINITVSVIMYFFQSGSLNITNAANVILNGFVSHTGNHDVDALLSRGGISSMMSSMSLIFVALAFGGLLMHLGITDAVMKPASKHLNSDGKLILAAILACIGVNVFIGEQYLSVILPGNAFSKAFKKAGLAKVALSRVLEDGGTVINYLVPWGVAGVFITNTLNVPTAHYLPFVFFSILSPILSVFSGFTGIGIKHTNQKN
ncbi:Na+/H+ antiporter NhaC [Philodulcilactobacillus myokoensis]|uniref:Na+/H+ antiporter NhaC n=1 Tax=Philodulcilactobacillus myokoensis TaxID=2929573 RepID=A0A9W6B1P6_9LACO|nr:Na+/H+ antiporter NhaC [Philodulcilactobacillus myokoensis]GLB47312.1 Na+/H+ antiporter NhaC [Philodulcilactobacillus myokoensis]